MTIPNYSASAAITEILQTVATISNQKINETKTSDEIINSYFLDHINELLQQINLDHYPESEKQEILKTCTKILNAATA